MSDHFPLMAPGAEPAGRTSVKSPWDLNEIATLDTAGEAGVRQALGTAHSLFEDRSAWLSKAERIEILRETAHLMSQRVDELALGAALEGGKPLADSLVETYRAIDGLHNCIDELRDNHGQEIPMGINAASMHRLAVTTREPIGVVVAVSAFNHPLNLIVHQVGPAVAAGCPVIVKPADDTPLSCYRLVGLLREAGLPPAWCQALITDTLGTAELLVTDARVAFFSFIGSARVGWTLRSKLAPGARCALEHGGAAPVIVAADADLDHAVPLLTKGGFYHAGQVCVSVQRVFAHRDIVAHLTERLSRAAQALKVGDPGKSDTEVGPLIRPGEAERVAEWVEEAIAAGAQLCCGGKRLSETTYSPTVLYDPPADVRVSREEIFGPVVCVYPYDELDDALRRANELPVAFQAAIFTRNLDTAAQAYRGLDASGVMVNDHTAFRVDWMPFAGLKQSGHGVGGIPHTFRDMQFEKMLVWRSPAF